MNVFRNRKKSVAEADGERPSFDSMKLPPMPTTPASRGRTIFRRKQQPEPKKEMDLAMVLPPSDDFRTSLLMPNLSARFSMLREQDDPNSKLGKANDDSVLFPKRTSKLDLFGHGLSDIAEVSSINGSIRPPFASDRDGYSSDAGYGTDDDGNQALNGSIMDRAKPGQGNKFFGGRQKVYKIPQDGAGSTRDLNAQDRRLGKPVYEEDVSMSVFQALRAKEKAERKFSEENSDYFDYRDDRSSKEHERDTKRATSSSTNSNLREGRVSTAATSIASQFGAKPSPVNTPGQERVGQKKRLYEHGLDQQIHDQQSSAVSRLNNISRGPSFPRSGSTGPTLSRSATNLNDKFRSSSPFSPVLRSGSPSPGPGFGGFDFGVNGRNTRSSSRGPDSVKQTPPMSPNTSSPVDPTLVSALDANDIGKATASGAFNKPKSTFNEQQFAQRQLQLQEGRNTPPLRSGSRTESGSDSSSRLRNGSLASVQSGQSSRPYHIDTSRAPSNASYHRKLVITPGSAQNLNGTYLADSSGSEYGSEPNSPEPREQTSDDFGSRKMSEDNRTDSRKTSEDIVSDSRKASEDRRPRPLPLDTHVIVQSFMDPTVGTPVSNLDTHAQPQQKEHVIDGVVAANAPVLDKPSNLGAGLNDLIRGHLRSDSGASSIYPASPGLPPEGFGQTARNDEPKTSDIHQNMSTHARQVLERANQLAQGPSKVHDVLGGVRDDKIQQVLGGEAPRRSNESSAAAWQDQLKIGHNRGGSTETQKEREEFANELAERRRAVQDNLMRSMEETSRSSSPAKNPEMSPAKNGGFSLLKKGPRGLTDDNPPKAMKMLGMSNASSNRASPDHGERAAMNRSRTASTTSDGRPKASAGNGPSFRERSIGAERRERFFRKSSAPAQAQVFEQQPNSPLPLPPGNHGFRSKSSPSDQPMSFHPAGRARKYSPPNTKPPLGPAPVALQQPPPLRARHPADRGPHAPRPPQNPASYFPPNTPDSAAGGFTTPASIDSPRHSPITPGYSAGSTPSTEYPGYPSGNRSRNRSVSKHDISGPTFVSGTSSQSTVDLPPGASLHNGMFDMRGPNSAPPLPPINPNRRRGRVELTQNVMTAFGGMPPPGTSSQPQSAHPDYEERSTFSGDEDDNNPRPYRPRARLRKISSEGGSIAAKARHQALMREAESIPGTPRLPTATQVASQSGRGSRKNSESRVR